jgi:hypothetical protein
MDGSDLTTTDRGGRFVPKYHTVGWLTPPSFRQSLIGSRTALKHSGSPVEVSR